MAVEIPEFKSCCLCFPLMPSLHACCLKIIAYVFIIPVVGYFLLIAYVMMCFGIGYNRYLIWILYSVMTLILLILLITDFIATIVFAFAGQEENLKLIRGYYKYNIGVLIVMTPMIVATIAIAIAEWGYSDTRSHFSYIAIVALQAYFILLLRRQVIKLESSSECRQIRE